METVGHQADFHFVFCFSQDISKQFQCWWPWKHFPYHLNTSESGQEINLPKKSVFQFMKDFFLLMFDQNL